AARAALLRVGHHHEWRHIRTDQTAHADERVRADFAELVHTGVAGHDHPVAHFDMAGEGGIGGEDRVVADDAVVRRGDVGQKPLVVADAGHAATAFGAAVHGDE